jgi:type III pantothenate kinase
MIAVDAGNTTIKVLEFNPSGEVVSLKKWPAAQWRDCAVALESCGVPVWIADTANRPWPLGTCVTAHHPWSFGIEYAAQLGSDRLAAMEGALLRNPGRSILMISCGTCLTFTYLHQGTRLQGGSIAPGWTSRLRALAEHTGSLPLLNPIPNEELELALSTDPRTATTEASMHRGVIQGILDQALAEVARFRQLDPDLVLILHGGDARALAGRIKNGIFADENWIALGLWSIAQRT